jgi:hypothetical protein
LEREIWHVVFDVKGYETVNRKFNYCILTDGYGATIRMQRPKADPNAPVKGKYMEKKRARNTQEGDEADGFDRFPSPSELDQYTHFVGVDPGVTFLTTSFDGVKHAQISAKEYRHMAKITQQNTWEKNLRKREQWYQDTIKDLPSFKTNHLETLLINLGVLLHVSDSIVDVLSRSTVSQVEVQDQGLW